MQRAIIDHGNGTTDLTARKAAWRRSVARVREAQRAELISVREFNTLARRVRAHEAAITTLEYASY